MTKATVIGLVALVAVVLSLTLATDAAEGKKAKAAASTAAKAKAVVHVKPAPKNDGVLRNVLLPPGHSNPRNSEGDFIQLKDGRLLFVYTHFSGDKGGDHSPAHLASRVSSDGGKTWSSDDVIVVPNEGDMNVMSVSLLRLADGRIVLCYLRKNSTTDCRPVLHFSSDEAQTWTEPLEVITDEVAYYVMNNDRLVQLSSGRLIVPVALHMERGKFSGNGRAMTYFSDDLGTSWKRSNVLSLDHTAGLQEPGLVALKGDKLMLFARTGKGSQHVAFSTDQGETWSAPQPSNIRSPLSPAAIERIPSTGDLLLVWNDNYDAAHRNFGARTPYNTAISTDEGKTWTKQKALEDYTDGWYCYTAIEFVGDRVVLGHCAGERSKGTSLAVTQITSFDVDWLYKD